MPFRASEMAESNRYLINDSCAYLMKVSSEDKERENESI
jgi:hypothetical protein